jgi:hypothetical protein
MKGSEVLKSANPVLVFVIILACQPLEWFAMSGTK